jgi:hypothetical protein
VLHDAWHLKLPEESFTALGLAWVGSDIFVVTGPGGVRRLDPARHVSQPVLEPTHAQSYDGSGGGAVAIAATTRGALVAMSDGVIVELDGDGSELDRRPGGLEHVTAIAAHGDTVAVCDRERGVVVVHHGDVTITVEGLEQPEALAVTADGVFVAEVGSRSVTRISAGDVGHVATGLPLGYPHTRPRGLRRCSLAAAPDGALLIGCDGDGSLRRLSA